MIEKMKFLSITGPKADIDRVTEKYLSKYEIHLENALAELTQMQNLTPYFEINPYKDSLNVISEYYDRLDNTKEDSSVNLSVEDSLAFIRDFDCKLRALEETRNALTEKKAALQEKLNLILPFRELNYDIPTILNFRFLKYRFGRIEKSYYSKFENYIYQNMDTLFFRCHIDEEYVWGIYFAPRQQAHKIDAVFSSMHFERFRIPSDMKGTPDESCKILTGEIQNLKNQIEENKRQQEELLNSNKAKIVAAKNKIETLSMGFDVRKVAACTKGEKDVFYILCGWMPESDAERFRRDIDGDDSLFCILEEQDHRPYQQPPTKLKNPKIFKPFEMYIRMYGLPAYNEMDPTWFVAITYSFIFGAMFGDVGQGLVLFIGGMLLYKFKKMDLAGIIGTAGIFSVFFGFMFGSIFGFEDVLPALWLRPVEHMSTVPFVGKLNTVFIISIAFGMCIILICMVFHIINGRKSHSVEDIFFDTNALAGLVFYGAVAAVVVLYMTGHALPGTAVLVIMFVIPLLVIFLKEPLTRLVERKSEIMPKQKGMFFVQGFFELFEVLLSYFSNTLSFVRIGAFAVSHAAMMEVVLMLAGAESGNPNIVVVILGNLFVTAMEGLVVGIQVLRLEYYEIFSRFYKGTGREFQPFLYRKTKK